MASDGLIRIPRRAGPAAASNPTRTMTAAVAGKTPGTFHPPSASAGMLRLTSTATA
jgi:hypothetical protein